MRITMMTRAAALTLALTALNVVPSAASANDIPETTLADSVSVSATITATAYQGWGPWTSRKTVSESYYSSAIVETSGGFRETVGILHEYVCVDSDYLVLLSSGTFQRRDDGWVLAHIAIWTWDECPRSGHHGAWSQRSVWVAPGDTETLEFGTRDGAGGATVRVSFRNYWTPKIDTTDLQSVLPGLSGFNF